MRIYPDPFEQLLAEAVRECAEEMNNLQPQDLTFIPGVVYLGHVNDEPTIPLSHLLREFNRQPYSRDD